MPKAPQVPEPDPEQITITISGYTFQLLAPYAAGQPLGLAEAGLLNREWAGAVRLGFAQRVQQALEDCSGTLSNGQLAALQISFQDYAEAFAFKAAPSRTADPIVRQKHAIAKRILDIKLNSLGLTRATFGEHKYEAALARLMNNPQVIAQAQEQLASARSVADELAGMTENLDG